MTLYCSAGRTDVGKVRACNEDAILLRDDIGLWVVADGLGGHAAGDYASALIVERLAVLKRSGDVIDFIEAIEDALAQVNAELLRCAFERRVDVIGSTVVVLVHDHDCMLCGWVGDSRGYCFEDGSLRRLTRDHVCGATDSPSNPAGPARASGVLTRAIGAEPRFFMDWVVAGSRPGMQFVLCTDGVYKNMSDDELDEACRRAPRPRDLLARLFDLVMGGSARDNLSAVIVRLEA